jgi:transcriptional regulator with XRE-family HTH domain
MASVARLTPEARDMLDAFAATVRSSRRARRWSQARLATELRLSAGHVSRLERSRVPDLSFRLASRTPAALGGRVEVRFIGVVGGAPAQRDRAHARCVSYVAKRLEAAGFLVATEVELGEGRWRTFVDVMALDPRERVLLTVEIKTEIRDVGEIDRQIGLAERGAWAAAHARGWRPRAVVPALLLLSTRENDRRLVENRPYFEARYRMRAGGLQAIVDGKASLETLRVRAVAMIDPRSRRRGWLVPTWLDGRRTPARHPDRLGYLASAAALLLMATALGGCAPTVLTTPGGEGSPSAPAPASATPGPIAVDAGGARAALERFLGRSVEVEVSGPQPGANGAYFELRGPTISAAVSAADGRVISVLLLDAMPGSRTVTLSPEDARAKATAYAGARGVSLDGLSAVVELMDHGDSVAYEVTWTKVDRGILLPVTTTMQVDASSGTVFSFLDFRRPFVEPPNPTVSRDLAVASARVAASMPRSGVDSARLRVTFAPDGSQQLVWEVALTAGISHALVDVDALTGAAVVVGRG